MNTIAKIGLIGAGFLGAGFIAASLYRQKKLLEDTCIKKDRIKINSLNPLNIDLGLLVKNKSSFTLKLREQKYDVYLNDKHIAKITKEEDVFILPGSNNLQSINIKSSIQNILQGGLLALMGDKNKNKLIIKSSLHVTTGIKINNTILYIYRGNLSFDIEYTIAELMAPSTESKEKEC